MEDGHRTAMIVVFAITGHSIWVHLFAVQNRLSPFSILHGGVGRYDVLPATQYVLAESFLISFCGIAQSDGLVEADK